MHLSPVLLLILSCSAGLSCSVDRDDVYVIDPMSKAMSHSGILTGYFMYTEQFLAASLHIFE